MGNTDAGVLGFNQPIQLFIKQSDARRIFQHYVSTALLQNMDLDALEKFFNKVLTESSFHGTVTVLSDEYTKEETRELLLEDTVQQWFKKFPRYPSRNLAAFTEAEPSYPAYLSANRDDNGDVIFTARERGHAGNKSVNVTMSAQDAAAFAHDFYKNTR